VTPGERLVELGLALPAPPAAVGAYAPWQRVGNLVTTSFQLPWEGTELAFPQVLNGASELVSAVFGERGRHARTALGHMVMPLRSPVMVGFWAELA
jgi:hypothetical protein